MLGDKPSEHLLSFLCNREDTFWYKYEIHSTVYLNRSSKVKEAVQPAISKSSAPGDSHLLWWPPEVSSPTLYGRICNATPFPKVIFIDQVLKFEIVDIYLSAYVQNEK